MLREQNLMLSLDLSSATGTLAIHQFRSHEFHFLIEEEISTGNDHCERLLDSLTLTLKKANATVNDVTSFITTRGPGSFTGLRIAYSAFKAFSLANEVPFTALSGTEARAMAYLRQNSEAKLPLHVLTQVSSKRFAHAEFTRMPDTGALSFSQKVTEGVRIEGIDPFTVLLDGKMELAAVSLVGNADQVVRFPLRARHLGDAHATAQSAETYANLAAWISATPEYFGTSFVAP